MKIRILGSIGAFFILAACGGEASTSGAPAGSTTSTAKAPGRSAIASTSSSGAPGASTKPTEVPGSSGSATAPSSASPSTSASSGPTAAASSSLDALFDGPPDAAIKMAAKPFVVGKATVGVPDGWTSTAVADSVDAVKRADGAAAIVVIRLDVSEAYLDMNVAQWVKNPFATGDAEVKWEPRTTGKLGLAHLEAKVAKGAGKIGKDDAEFFQAAVQGPDKKYPLLVVAGVKKAADPSARAEMTAALKSIEWK